MIKKVLLGIIAIFIFVFTFANIAEAASTNTSAKKVTPPWDKKIIKVYVPQDTNAAAMKNAFGKWQTVSSGKIQFQYVPKDKADITVEFTDKAEGLESKLGGYSVGSTDGKKKATIKIASKSPAAKKYSKNYMYITMLHQVGHVLGLPDNSTKPTSIMYMPISEKQSVLKIDVRKLYSTYGWSYANRNMPSQR